VSCLWHDFSNVGGLRDHCYPVDCYQTESQFRVDGRSLGSSLREGRCSSEWKSFKWILYQGVGGFNSTTEVHPPPGRHVGLPLLGKATWWMDTHVLPAMRWQLLFP
jgi:hypothetical protein